MSDPAGETLHWLMGPARHAAFSTLDHPCVCHDITMEYHLVHQDGASFSRFPVAGATIAALTGPCTEPQVQCMSASPRCAAGQMRAPALALEDVSSVVLASQPASQAGKLCKCLAAKMPTQSSGKPIPLTEGGQRCP